jgi:oligopeptide/dipeptide ABC transporter ATP-binding protein
MSGVPPATAPLLDVRALTKVYPPRRGLLGATAGAVRAIDGISFTIAPGEILGLVGESGSGKSTIARLVLRLLEPTSGEVRFAGEDLLRLDRRRLRAVRRRLQIVFQDPAASLNPRLSVGAALGEALALAGFGSGRAARERIAHLLTRVGLEPAHASRYPHEFSGGQRQRIAIARALAVEPALIVADEPVSALDVSVGAQIVNLLADLRREQGIAYLFITHDLRLVERIADRVAVLYAGRVVEIGPTAALFAAPLHPYTHALLAAVPEPDPAASRRPVPLGGEPADPAGLPAGCAFHPRCTEAIPDCARSVPPWEEKRPGCWARCLRIAPYGMPGVAEPPPVRG